MERISRVEGANECLAWMKLLRKRQRMLLKICNNLLEVVHVHKNDTGVRIE